MDLHAHGKVVFCCFTSGEYLPGILKDEGVPDRSTGKHHSIDRGRLEHLFCRKG